MRTQEPRSARDHCAHVVFSRPKNTSPFPVVHYGRNCPLPEIFLPWWAHPKQHRPDV